MSNTIVNKKGNIGFLVTPWNFRTGWVHCSEDEALEANSIYPHSREVMSHSCRHDGDTPLQLMIKKVRVHSCGKVVMRLHELEDTLFFAEGELSGAEYSPNTRLYVDENAAIDAAKELHKQLLINTSKRDAKTTPEDSVLACYPNQELEIVRQPDWVAKNKGV